MNSAEQVFKDRLRRRRQGKLEEDTARNYANDVVLLTTRGVFRGKARLCRSVRPFQKEPPCARYQYWNKLVDGDMAFLERTARCDGTCVDDGADSFLIRDGRIVAQTTCYTVRREADGQ